MRSLAAYALLVFLALPAAGGMAVGTDEGPGPASTGLAGSPDSLDPTAGDLASDHRAAAQRLVPPMAPRPAMVLPPDPLHSLRSPPSGPAVPTIQDGIGPGSALQQHEEVGDGGGYICTAGFLLRDPATAKYYLSTAGHCLVLDAEDPEPYTGATDPEALMQEILICVSGCMGNALGFGEYVTLSAGGGYHPVFFAQSGGVGLDFGVIELPDSLHGELRPWMPQWGGPTGYDPGNSGDRTVHYGHGSYCCPLTGAVGSRTPADQGRMGTSLGTFADGSFQGAGHITGGDSGSAMSLAVADPARVVQGTTAVGILTHSLGIEVSLPLYLGTTMEQGLALTQEKTGLALELVLQDDPLPTAPTVTYEVTIDAPADGARLEQPGQATVRGTASSSATLPAGAAVQLALDDAGFAEPNRLDVTGLDSWQATWALDSWAVGDHTLHARLVDGSGAVLAQAQRSVTVRSAGGGGGGDPTEEPPGPDPGEGPGKTPPGPDDGDGDPADGNAAPGGGASRSAPQRGSPAPGVALLAVLVVGAALRSRR